MEYKFSIEQVRRFYNSARITERVTKAEEGISHSGEDFRKEMAISALEKLPNPGTIEKYATSLEDFGLDEEARKLRTRYYHIQRFSRGDTETSEEG